MPIYRLEYVVPGQRPRAIEYPSGVPLQAGQQVWAEGVQLVVERVLRQRPGETGPQIVLCKLASSCR